MCKRKDIAILKGISLVILSAISLNHMNYVWAMEDAGTTIERKMNDIEITEMENVETEVMDDQRTPSDIVASVKGLPYIGGKSYNLSLYWSEDNRPSLTLVNEMGVLGAIKLDLDEDGIEEIFAVTFEPSSYIQDGGSIHFSILRQEGENWNILTEKEIISQRGDGTYEDMSCLNGAGYEFEGSVFVRKYNGNYEFFYESYRTGLFATGQGWFLQGFRYENGELGLIPETQDIYYEGSPIDQLWMESNDGYGYTSIIDQYESLDFNRPYIDFDHMTVDQQPSLYSILSLRQDNTSSADELMEWMRNQGETLNTVIYSIEDYSEDIPKVLEEFQISQTEKSDITTNTKEYYIADSNSRYLTDQDVGSMSADEIQMAINEIYARHGRVFKTPQIDTYFQSKSWYQPNTSKTDDQIMAEFNEFEKYNMELLSKYR